MDIGNQLIDHVNNGDCKAILALGTKDCKVTFVELSPLSWKKYVQVLDHVMASFPDLKFSCSSAEEVSANQASMVIVVSGTHTGADYGLVNTPGCPKTRASGVRATNDPEKLVLTINDQGKIQQLDVVATGEMTGPAGLYMQAAGLADERDSAPDTSQQVPNAILEVVHQLVRHVNRGDSKAILALATPDCTVAFADVPIMSWSQFVESVDHIRESFPDFKYTPSEQEVVSSSKVSVVIVVSGTHIGVPYELVDTPGFPAVNAKGIKVVNDPETLVISVRGGKIQHMEVVPSSENTGPQGLYMQVAGLVF